MVGSKKSALVILAAGESKRLGSPKQLLKINGISMIKHIMQMGLSASFNEVIVVTGGYREEVEFEVVELGGTILFNKNFKEGMSTSMSTALTYLEVQQYDYAVCSVCDQPFLSTEVFQLLIGAYTETGDIIVSKYSKGQGTPMLIDSAYFAELKELSGDKGARELVLKYPEKVKTIDFEKGNIDLDIKPDVDKYLS